MPFGVIDRNPLELVNDTLKIFKTAFTSFDPLSFSIYIRIEITFD